jgi:uncharacterized protein YgiM (DUF1202 family)
MSATGTIQKKEADMKRMLQKKLPKLIVCWGVIIGMVLTSSPAFSKERKSSYGGDITYKRDRDQGRDRNRDRDNRSRDRDRYHDRDRYRDRDRCHDRDRCDNRCSNCRKNKSRQTRVVHKNDVLPAIIVTGIIAGVTLSLLDNDPAPAPVAPPPASYPSVGQGVVTGSVVVTAALLNVRSGPGMGKPCVGQLYRGATLSVMGSNSGWYYVQASTGVSGWVMARYTSSVGSMG